MGGLLSCVWVNEHVLNGEYVGIITIMLTEVKLYNFESQLCKQFGRKVWTVL